jgi:pyruvate dehydrogenase E2 component (dihydrolipoamide acetyltransferase)
MEEGTVLTWIKGDGEVVSAGDVIAEIESDKAISEYETEAAGVLRHFVEAGATVLVGVPIAAIEAATSAGGGADAADASVPAIRSETTHETPPEPARDTTRDSASPPARLKAQARPLASPVARRIAATNGIDMAAVVGSGPRGRIMRSDVQEIVDRGAGLAAARPSEAPGGESGGNGGAPAPGNRGRVTEQQLSRAQQVIAKRMSESRATIPDFEVRVSVDALPITELRKELRATESEAIPSVNDFIVKAAASALREIPRANGTYQGDRWELWERINIGIAVATDDGLLVPTLFDADQLSLRAISRQSRELAQKAREGRLSPAEMSGGTFTISNLGMFGIRGFSAVISAPQAAILSVGAAIETPVVRDSQVVPGLKLELGLACDHRILYGADAARLLVLIRGHLESPLGLLVL